MEVRESSHVVWWVGLGCSDGESVWCVGFGKLGEDGGELVGGEEWGRKGRRGAVKCMRRWDLVGTWGIGREDVGL